jgi:hypothetical protein
MITLDLILNLVTLWNKASQENRINGRGGYIALTTRHPLSAKVGTNFVDKWRSLGQYSSLAD